MKKIVVIAIVVILIMITIGCISDNPKREEEKGPTLTLTPITSGVRVSEGYAILNHYGSADVSLPKDYHLPKVVMMYKIDNSSKQYTVILGNESFPEDDTRYISLSEEIKIENLREGVTKVILTNKS